MINFFFEYENIEQWRLFDSSTEGKNDFWQVESVAYLFSGTSALWHSPSPGKYVFILVCEEFDVEVIASTQMSVMMELRMMMMMLSLSLM